MTTSVFLTVQETEPESPPRASLEPALWSNLSNLNATEGSTVALECSVRNQGNYSLRWSNSTRSLSTSALARDVRVFVKKEILRDVTKWSLMIKNVSKEDEGKYYCFINSIPPIIVVLNLSVQESHSDKLPKSVLEPTLWSNSYNHSVQGLDSDNLPSAPLEPTLWSNSPNHSVVEGSTAVLECNVSNQGNYKLIWIFVPKSLLLTISTHTHTIDPRYSASRESQGNVTKWSLTIKNTTREDEGSYICQVNTEFKKYLIVNLTIQEPDSKLHPMSLEPTLWSNYPNSTAIEGLNVVLECSVGNQGDYRIAWIFVPTEQILTISTHVITHDQRFSVAKETQEDVTKWSLTIRHATFSDEGGYRCLLNTNPEREFTVNLRIPNSAYKGDPEFESPKAGPAILWSDAPSVSVAEGSKAVLRCATNTSLPVMWMRGGGNSRDSLSAGYHLYSDDARLGLLREIDRDGVSEWKLVIRSVDRVEDAGTYSCRLPGKGLKGLVQIELSVKGRRPPRYKSGWGTSRSGPKSKANYSPGLSLLLASALKMLC